ncbi:MAG: hypothetical protein BWX71_01141 [Deltaproteobacteria bacterium ADurb.Bin072]|nr:MAG: hypothetical protein BWX71_01141 [Deltaproteobacteria bacterium ADurb.Bin072]
MSLTLPCSMMAYPFRCRPVSRKRSVMSLSRHLTLLMRYSLSPVRKSRLVTETCSNPSSVFGNEPPSRTNSRETLASEPGPASWVPENITSFMADALRDLADCSPRAHLTASMMLLLPHPLGPAMQVTPLDTARVVFFAIDLKPLISILDNFTPQALAELDGHRKRPDDPWWNTRKSLAFRARNLHIRS